MGLNELLLLPEETLTEGQVVRFTWSTYLHNEDHLLVQVAQVLPTFAPRFEGFTWTSGYNLFTNPDPGLQLDGSGEQVELVGDSREIVIEWVERTLLERFPELAWYFNPSGRKTALERIAED
jgi:hypothetical protein